VESLSDTGFRFQTAAADTMIRPVLVKQRRGVGGANIDHSAGLRIMRPLPRFGGPWAPGSRLTVKDSFLVICNSK